MGFYASNALLLYVWIYSLPFAISYDQLVNTAITVVSSSSTYSDGSYAGSADKTIDRNFDQEYKSCMHTDVGRSEAWLQIDLGGIFNLKSVKLWYRNERNRGKDKNTRRLKGFSILASHLSNVDKRYQCYQDPGNVTLDTVLEVNCTRLARYVTIYNDQKNDPGGVFLEICEVEIYGCPRYRYGEDCTRCDTCNAECDVTGQCDTHGCKEGYHPSFCKVCIPGIFGNDCKEVCGYCERKEPCNHINGSCPGLCEPGYYGEKCLTPCSGGFYGKNCHRRCGHCLHKARCNHETGYCPDELCEPGYKKKKCNEECDDGYFGNNCKEECGHCAGKMPCNKTDGTCPGECADGWITPRCNEICSPGRYGKDCKEVCGYCERNEPCNHITGSCPRLCEPGYYGEKCLTPCTFGRYGEGCKGICGHCESNKTCNYVNGSCPGLCEPGYHGENCLTTNNQAIKNKTNAVFSQALYGVTIILFLSILLNIFLIVRNARKFSKKTKRQQNSKNVENRPVNKILEDNVGYQELGELSLPSIYEKVDKKEHKESYQELGQLSQPSLYDKLKTDNKPSLLITNKTKVESSSLYVWGSYSGDANKTIDRNFSQSYVACMQTAPGQSEAWLNIDLGRVFNLKSVRIWYRNDRGAYNTKRLSGFSVLVSNNSEWSVNDTCYQDSANVTLETVLEVNCFHTAQYVKIYANKNIDGGAILEICELEIYGNTTGCSYQDNNGSCISCDECKNDCNINGECDEWGCKSYSLPPPFCKGISSNLRSTVKVKREYRATRLMGAATEVVKMDGRISTAMKITSFFTVHLVLITMGFNVCILLILFTWINNFYRVSCYDQLVRPGYTMASSSSVDYDGYPNKTVDGDFRQNNYTYCMHTAVGHTEAWLRIDLRKIYNIQSVKFWYRNDSRLLGYNTRRIQGFNIRLSNTTQTIPRHICYQDDGSRRIPPILEIMCEGAAQYVWVYTNRNFGFGAFLEICEMKVFGCSYQDSDGNCIPCDQCKGDCNINGECDEQGCKNESLSPPYCKECRKGLYGRNCSNACGFCDKQAVCDQVNGSCPSGHCEPGWKHTLDQRCNEECDNRTYGLNCSHNCGRCAEGLSCNKVAGTCPKGCEDGWTNIYCNESKHTVPI
ncbi:uncharacterized protein LOC134251989 [Saccostrea cucullata]|uniref:uncharacterized protein LOC134251989 n=1 Tax=Saccostrea cuccullata TaxID=36930 RepID=UPI002ED3EF35